MIARGGKVIGSNRRILPYLEITQMAKFDANLKIVLIFTRNLARPATNAGVHIEIETLFRHFDSPLYS